MHVVPAFGELRFRGSCRSNQEGHVASMEQDQFSKEMTSPWVRPKGQVGTGQHRHAVKVGRAFWRRGKV